MTEASTPLNGAQSGHGSGGLNATRVATTKFKAIPIPVETDSQNTWHLVVMLIVCVASIFVCFASAALCYRSANLFWSLSLHRQTLPSQGQKHGGLAPTKREFTVVFESACCIPLFSFYLSIILQEKFEICTHHINHVHSLS